MTVPATKVGPKFQVTIPQQVREAVGLKTGDLVQASVGDDGAIVLRRKVLVDHDPELERDFEAAKADVEAGRVLGQFESAPDALRALSAFKRRAHARRDH
jgi:AbrB family looped-hinge helix DNA binding protein